MGQEAACGANPMTPKLCNRTLASAPGMPHLYSEGVGDYAAGPFQLQPSSLVMALHPGQESNTVEDEEVML